METFYQPPFDIPGMVTGTVEEENRDSAWYMNRGSKGMKSVNPANCIFRNFAL
jgi:hypothetical protein